MSKYTFQDSIDDGATLELNFREVPVEMHLDEARLQEAFDEMARENELTEEEKDQLTKGTKVEAFFTSPKRIHEVCDHIVKHYRQYVRPTGLKCQVVVYNRACCVAYKKELDAMLAESGDETAIVMHTSGDKGDEFKEYKLTNDQQEKLLNKFRDPLSPLKFVIVTSKLLTGFDAPILQCMYLDKPMKDHTLLQAVCRTNRVYEAHKKCGLIVDYVGVFDNYANSLRFDEATVKTVIKNIKEVKSLIPNFLKDCLDFFPGVDVMVRKETDILLRDIGGERVHSRGQVGKSAALCLSQPGFIVAVAVKDNAAVRCQFSLYDRSHTLVKVCLFVVAGIQLIFQLIGKEHELMRHHRVENDVGT